MEKRVTETNGKNQRHWNCMQCGHLIKMVKIETINSIYADSGNSALINNQLLQQYTFQI